jgi:hypothetical protein
VNVRREPAVRRLRREPTAWYSARDANTLLAGRPFGFIACYLRVGEQVYETYWSTDRGAEAMAWSYALLDRTIYGRQEVWEDSPEGWPHDIGTRGEQFRIAGRPTIQWSFSDPDRARSAGSATAES